MRSPIRTTILHWLILLAVAVPAAAVAAPRAVLRDAGPGTVDWANETVLVLGVAPPVIKSVAVAVAPADPDAVSRKDASRKLLDAMHHLPTRGAATVGDLAAGDSALAARLAALSERYEVERVRRFSSGGMSVAARLDVDAVRAALGAGTSTTVGAATAAPGPDKAAAGGVIIDATRARAFVPCLLPSLRGPDDSSLGTADHARSWRYAARVSDARAMLRAPKAPVLKAKAVAGDETVLILGAADAKRANASAEMLAALRDGRVVVVVGKPLKKKPIKAKAGK